MKGEFATATENYLKVASALAISDANLLPLTGINIASSQIYTPENLVQRNYDAAFTNEWKRNQANDVYTYTNLNLYKNIMDFARNVNEYGYSRTIDELNCWKADNSLKDGMEFFIFTFFNKLFYTCMT